MGGERYFDLRKLYLKKKKEPGDAKPYSTVSLLALGGPGRRFHILREPYKNLELEASPKITDSSEKMACSLSLSLSLSAGVTVPKLGFSCCSPSSIWKPNPNPNSSKPPKASCSAHNKNKIKNPLAGIGIGVVAASVVGLTPLDADATRIQYYATVGEPLCEYNYVKSGLGYCDIVEGFGDEAPLGELINVSHCPHSLSNFKLKSTSIMQTF